MGTSFSLPSFSPAKDPADYPLFQGKISRWAWRMLTHRLTYTGRWFAAASIILISYSGASSLTLQSYVPAGYVGIIWLVAVAGMLLHRPRVRLRARLSDRSSVGQILPVDVEIEQRSRWARSDLVVLPHNLPAAIDSVPSDGVAAPFLRKGESAKIQLGLRCNKRGKHLVRGFRVESGFPFSILRWGRTFEASHAILVYPTFNPLTRLNLPTGRRYQPGGVAMASNLGESFEYLGNREYRPGDNVRDIDWRATARLQRPIVREWVEEYMLRVAVILDTHVPKGSKPESLDAFERAVSTAAAVADYMARQDYLVDLFAAGPNLYHLTAGRSLAYLDQILDILACVESNPDEPFNLIEPQLAELLERLSTVICVFLDWNETRRAFVENLRGSGVAVKVIILRDGPCALSPDADVSMLGKMEFDRGVDEI